MSYIRLRDNFCFTFQVCAKFIQQACHIDPVNFFVIRFFLFLSVVVDKLYISIFSRVSVVNCLSLQEVNGYHPLVSSQDIVTTEKDIPLSSLVACLVSPHRHTYHKSWLVCVLLVRFYDIVDKSELYRP